MIRWNSRQQKGSQREERITKVFFFFFRLQCPLPGSDLHFSTFFFFPTSPIFPPARSHELRAQALPARHALVGLGVRQRRQLAGRADARAERGEHLLGFEEATDCRR